MLTQTGSYYCDKDAVAEPIAASTIGRGKVDFGGAKGREYDPDESDPNFRNGSEQWGRTYDYTQSNGNGSRNLRSVWAFPTKSYSRVHRAVFPPKLPEICIKSSTSEKGCCPKCGSPWARVVDKGRVAEGGEGYNTKFAPLATGLTPQGFQRANTLRAGRDASRLSALAMYPGDSRAQQDYINFIHDHRNGSGVTVGWRPTCTCNAGEPVPCRVLDPFGGAGTTALVSEQLGLDSVSIDTSAEYTALAQARIAEAEEKRIVEQVAQLARDAKIAAKQSR